jgi:hypothetical protein
MLGLEHSVCFISIVGPAPLPPNGDVAIRNESSNVLQMADGRWKNMQRRKISSTFNLVDPVAKISAIFSVCRPSFGIGCPAHRGLVGPFSCALEKPLQAEGSTADWARLVSFLEENLNWIRTARRCDLDRLTEPS